MNRMMSQKEIYDYLLANPLNVAVHIGDLDDMQGKDYIFLDYTDEREILRDNNADYQSIIQISVYTRNFENRKTLVNYIQKKFLSAPSFTKSDEADYYVATFSTGIFLSERYQY